MTDDVAMRGRLRVLFDSQRYAVLATDDCGQPFTSLMAFAVTDDLRHLVILSDRNTRKCANLAANRRVTLLVNDRGNKTTDTQESIAVTVVGRAYEAYAGNGAALGPVVLGAPPRSRRFRFHPRLRNGPRRSQRVPVGRTVRAHVETAEVKAEAVTSGRSEPLDWHACREACHDEGFGVPTSRHSRALQASPGRASAPAGGVQLSMST